MVNTWKNLETMDQFEDAIKGSYNRPIVLFKHSVTCGISARAKFMLEDRWDFNENDFDFYYLDLLSFRNISNEIADRFKVRHQSPQILIVRDGQAVFDMSHHRISADSLKSALGSK